MNTNSPASTNRDDETLAASPALGATAHNLAGRLEGAVKEIRRAAESGSLVDHTIAAIVVSGAGEAVRDYIGGIQAEAKSAAAAAQTNNTKEQ